MSPFLTLVPVIGTAFELETLRTLRNADAEKMTRDTAQISPEAQAAWWRTLDRDRDRFFLAYHRDAEGPVGYGAVREDDQHRPWLTGLIAEPFRSRGWGRELFQRLAETALWPGRDVWLEVRESNVPALRLYDSLGYRAQGVKTYRYESNGEPREVRSGIMPMKLDRQGPQVVVLVFSYNRPQMLLDALASIHHADQVVILDDGSDFLDVDRLLNTFCDGPWQTNGCPVSVIQSPARAPETRMIQPSLGTLANAGLAALANQGFAPDTMVAYLCDDDLFHPHWLARVRREMGANPDSHVCRGAWFEFQDGQPLSTARPCNLDSRQLTAGNFAHRLACYQDEGLTWDTGTVAIHDDAFTRRLDLIHPVWNGAVPLVPGIAGYRRVHPGCMMNWAASQFDYKPETVELFATGQVGR